MKSTSEIIIGLYICNRPAAHKGASSQLKPGRNEGNVLGKTFLQQRDKVSTCMVKIGQESLTWKVEIMKLLRLTVGKEISSKANDTV